MKKNLFLTFITACIPGFGPMYYGLMRRGLSIGFWFSAIFALTTFLNMNALVIFLPLVWAYSFFDTFNIRALTAEQYNTLSDNFVPDILFIQTFSFEKLSVGKSQKYLGWGLIILGGLFIYNLLINSALSFLTRIPILGDILYSLPGLIIGLIVALIGITMIRGRKPDFVDQLEKSLFADDLTNSEQQSQDVTLPLPTHHNPSTDPTATQSAALITPSETNTSHDTSTDTPYVTLSADVTSDGTSEEPDAMLSPENDAVGTEDTQQQDR